ncbi:phospholipid-translocating P-type ATPase, flippase family protein [Tritrichomonas foetus]|uniref:Phospholipid-transporting ATPase n=1 Tax=Tritrichomonas foetus TaxID=1144522 RepID=A0A1J4KET4_9EUKA|nr:phospholipid-translocating P-type ATPase, flippase family protein [Tritrichomonas foetus]|eukprot:OHT09943.1 phospholipid-translocating P-type ATPase, flippase family protein [Tritrichomonas foetus]
MIHRKSSKKFTNKMEESELRIEFPVKERIPGKNSIKTSHYTWWNFIFLNLFEQFHRLANIFFLLVATLQAIPVISPLNPVMGFLSLGFMLLISMAKAGFEDYQRHVADDILNNKKTTIYDENGNKEVTWADVNPGDIIVLKTDQEFPADCIILEASSNDNKCRIETAALDGETNLKFRSVVTSRKLIDQSFSVFVSDPKAQLSYFSGRINYKNEEITLQLNNFVPRSCFLRNTSEVKALVVYSGQDTKVMLNSMKPKYKFTEIDKFLSNVVIVLFFVLIVISICFDVGAYMWANSHYHDLYLELEQQSTIYYFYNVFSWLLIINNMIPLCVYSSLDLVRFFLSFTISSDINMKDDDRGVKCKNSDLVSTIGRITHIFSDKTGTLTKNKMTFKSVGFRDSFYGKGQEPIEFDDNEKLISMSEKDIEEFKENLDNEELRMFLMNVCLCNSAVTMINPKYYTIEEIHEYFPDYEYSFDLPAPEIVAKFPYIISYQTASSDEIALLHFARECGFILYNITGDDVQLIIDHDLYTIDRPVVFEFSSQRRRHSVIVYLDGKYKLMIKGADSAILARSVNVSEELKQKVDFLSSNGLRTLVFGVKDLDNVDNILGEYNRIRGMTFDFEEALEALGETVELGFDAFAVSGVMDELQDEVVTTFTKLHCAGIKIWMMTGDKLDTALKIALSSGLRKPHQPVLIVEKHDDLYMISEKQACDYIFAIEGSNINALFEDDLFNSMASQAKSVICARCEPSQKGNGIRVFKKMNPKSRILAIGDGANDVDMIRIADVGVGVEGKEGSDAVMSADFALPSFRHIARLLIVHGRWCTNRTSLLITMTFYKTTMIAFTQMIFGVFNGFSATSAFDSGFLSLYNMILTIPQLFFICVFEEDVDAKYIMAVPEVYKEISKNGGIGLMPMIMMYIHALIHSVLIFFYSYFESNTVVLDKNCQTFDYPIFTQITGWSILIIFTIELLLKFKTMTIIHIGLYIACVIFYILVEYFYSIGDKQFYNILTVIFTMPRIWFLIPFVTGLCIAIDMIGLYLKPIFFPSLAESIAELEYSAKLL